ncbi:ATP synthase gamma chain [Ferrimicrobium acidiphilum DSM 19497]|uniref:ATP synthase gamma chain n=1 Tax=Ferrimicrobium acidiphilum DSM 19497 TaxID=1121877 RepID=A0A0D8FW94_9ACTN|nr:ATP synthase F1 subunit gamma [Ferrimicrobium acidiphilum]KJE77568.1 ATP synthase gamma chain [Ferrimicrobium acidiphilum DSM 19497]
MPGGKERALRGRIRSVNSTKKITKAMELIAASRIVKAVGRIGGARTYFREVSEVTRELLVTLPSYRPPLTQVQAGVTVLVLVTSDRGLCGGYNSSVIRAYEEQVRQSEGPIEIIGIGRRIENYLHFRGISSNVQINGVTHLPTLDQAYAIMGPVMRRVDAGEIARVVVISNRFYSLGVQRLEETILVPVDPSSVVDNRSETVAHFDFEAEPSLEAVIDTALHQLVVAEFFGLLLEASAAEHAARQRAMKSATDNATELVRNLTRAMNRVRQDAITTEITEIVGGAEALAQGSHAMSGDER